MKTDRRNFLTGAAALAAYHALPAEAQFNGCPPGFCPIGSAGRSSTRISLVGDSFFQQAIGGTSNAGLTSPITDRIDAMARGDIYHLLGKNLNFEHSNFNWSDAGNKYVVGGVNKRAYHSGANVAVGGSSTYGSVIDGFDADGTTPKQIALPFTNNNRAHIVFINFAANDLNAGRTATAISTKLQALAAYVITQGGIPVVCSPMPRATTTGIYSGSGSTWDTTDAKREQQGLLLTEMQGGSWCGAGQAIEFCDMTIGIADTGNLDSFGKATIPYDFMTEGDGLHPGTLGAWYRYVQMQAALDRIFAARGWGSTRLFTTDALDASNLLVAGGFNPAMTGTVGAKSGSGISGTIVGTLSSAIGSYALIRGGANAATTNVTAVGSVEAATGYNKQVIAFNAGATTAATAVGTGANSSTGLYDYESWVFEHYANGAINTLPALAVPGTYVRVLWDIECSAAGGFPGFRTISLDTNFYTSGSSQSGLAFKGGFAGKYGNSLYDHLPATFTTTLISEPLIIPANAAKFSCVLTIATANGFAGTGTLKISKPRMIIVTDPSLTWAAA